MERGVAWKLTRTEARSNVNMPLHNHSHTRTLAHSFPLLSHHFFLLLPIRYGAVAATSEIKNPIRVAALLAKASAVGEDPDGRICPTTLVASGAAQYAKAAGIPTVANVRKTKKKNKLHFFIFKKKRNVQTLQ